jgi:hypothetical protein
MSKKTMRVNVSYSYEIEVDTENSIVKEYETDSALVEDLVTYNFSSVLPVLKEGVRILDCEVVEWSL